MKEKLFFPLAAAFCLLALAPAAAYNPPIGSELAASFASPLTLGGGAMAAGGPLGAVLPAELLANPALSAGEQRLLLDISYAGLVSTEGESGYGNIVNLGAVIPTSFAVFGGSLNFIHSPFDNVLPLGTSLGANLSISKDLTERFYAGVGISARFGTGKAGIAGSVGALYNFGDLAFLKDFKLGIAFTGLGTAFRPKDTYGIKGGESDGFPVPFTPRAGVSFLVVKNSVLSAGFSAGAALPYFQNVVFTLGAEAEIKSVFFAKIGWTANILEIREDAASPIPSAAIGVRLRIGSSAASRLTGNQDWAQSELTPSIGYKYIKGGIHAVSAGATLRLGQKDEDGPEIRIELPQADSQPNEE